VVSQADATSATNPDTSNANPSNLKTISPYTIIITSIIFIIIIIAVVIFILLKRKKDNEQTQRINLNK